MPIIPPPMKPVKTIDNMGNGDSVTNPSPLSASEVAALDEMNREHLIKLIRACNSASVRVLMMTKEQQGQIILDMLLITAVTSQDRKEARECAKLWMDREIGTVIQKQATLLAVTDGKQILVDILREIDSEWKDIPAQLE